MTSTSRVLLGLLLGTVGSVAGANETLFDPTRPSGASANSPPAAFEELGGLQLHATRIAPGKRTVVINGVVVEQGQRIGSAQVLGIEHGQVELDVEGRQRILRLLPNEVKKVP